MTRRELNPDELGALFPAVRRACWRWECQPQYTANAEEVEAWLAGEPLEPDEDSVWFTSIRELATKGIPVERVRVIDNPRTIHQQWIATTTDSNVAAGEDIRWLPRARARELDMPTYDFYVFDEDRVAIMRFDVDGDLTGIELDDDPDVVATHLDYRARVWPIATPHDQMAR